MSKAFFDILLWTPLKIAQSENKPTNFPFFLREGLLMRGTNKPHLCKKNRKAFEVVEQICIPISTNNWIRKIFLYSVHGLPLPYQAMME